MAMAHSTANWHWKNKNCTSWARSWFQDELVTVSISGEGTEQILVAKVTEVDGDVELGQRKSKCVGGCS
jgi:activator of HSP90 ATPase